MRAWFERPFVSAAFTLGLCLVVAGVVFSLAFYNARSTRGTLSVTGSAKIEVKADTAKWTISVHRQAFQEGQQAAYGTVAREGEAVKQYFVAAGIPAADITTNTIVADQDWSYNSQGGPTRYNVHQEVTIESKDVDKVAGLAQNVTTLINRGYSLTPRQPEYYVSNLPELRIQLLGKAIEDAKARATEIAKSGGARVGSLMSASSGVVQVLAPNSTNVEDYGSYDTSTVEKEVSVTARASFEVR